MKSNILQKCVDELSKENPKLDYIRGMLETLIEMESKPEFILTNDPYLLKNQSKDSETLALEARLPPNIAEMQKMISTE